MVEDGRTPYLTIQALQELGYALALYPVSALLVVARRLQDTYAAMRQAGRLPEHAERLRFGEYNTMIGLDELVPSAIAS
jgi:2-methylisocitrate lyase-like PEP mutase family enzyme